jgi:hypothetical protein
MIERHSVFALLLAGCGTTHLNDDSSAVSRDWFVAHIPPGSALEQSVIEIANDASLDLQTIGVPPKTATAVAALRGPDGYRTIAEIDDAPHTNIPFFETLIAYANRNIHGGHARSGCTRPQTNPPPDSLLAFDAHTQALSWAFAVPEHGMGVDQIGITVRNPSGAPGTIVAAIVDHDNDTDPLVQLATGDVIASTLIDVPPTHDPIALTGAIAVDLVPKANQRFPYAIVFASGFAGATLPRFEVATWVVGECADAHAYLEAWPEFADTNPLETAPELFVETVDRCD